MAKYDLEGNLIPEPPAKYGMDGVQIQGGRGVSESKSGTVVPIDLNKYREPTETPAQAAGNQQFVQASKSIEPSKLTEYLPLLLGIGGEIAGGPVASGIGTAMGELAHSATINRGIPPAEDVLGAGATGLLNTVLGGGLNSLRQKLVGKVLQKTMPQILPDAEKAAVAQFGPQLEMDVAQTTGNPRAQALKKIASPQVLAAQTQKQQGLIGDVADQARELVTGFKTPDTVGEDNILKARLRPNLMSEDKAWNTLRGHVAQNVQKIPTMGGDVDVAGPIHLDETKNFATSVKPELDNLFTYADDITKRKLLPFKQAIDKAVQTGVTDAKTGNQYLDFETAQSMRSALDKVSRDSQLKNTTFSRAVGGLDALKNRLDNDIAASVNTWSNQGPGIYDLLDKAKLATKSRVRAEAFDKILFNATDQASGKFNADKFLNDLKDPTSQYRTVFSAKQRADLEPFFRAIRAVNNSGNVSLINGRFIINNASELPTKSFSGVAKTRLAIALGGRQFAEKVLLDPNYARLAAKLPSLPPNSQQAGLITKTLMRALRGEQVWLMTPDGKRASATVDENGKAIPDFQGQ